MRPDPTLAVYLAPLPAGWGAWVIPGAHGVCLDAVNSASRRAQNACATLAAASAGRLILRYPAGVAGRLLGLASDTQTKINLTIAGQPRTVPVTNNAWTTPAT